MQRTLCLYIRVRAADPVWLCFLHLSLCTTLSIKPSLKNKEMDQDQDQFHESLVSPCRLFFLTLLFRLIPIWSTEVPHVYLFAWASETWMGRRPASSLPQETGRAPAAYVNGASLLSRDFIDFLCKPRNIRLFLSSILLTANSFRISL